MLQYLTLYGRDPLVRQDIRVLSRRLPTYTLMGVPQVYRYERVFEPAASVEQRTCERLPPVPICTSNG